MIGSDEMSSTSMDISETFRPEDLSKTDFFDFVTAPDMGIGIGVVGDRPPGSVETNGTNDQPLQGYDQFWGSDKDHSRLETAIFEDLDRYCWQQSSSHAPTQHHQPSSTNPSSVGSSISQPSSLVGSNNANGLAGVVSNTDGQIYTLTVLNGNEPWLKRDPDSQIAPALDLDSLLGSFPSYVKSEFVYEDSGFSTDNTKEDGSSHHQQSQQHQQAQHQQNSQSNLAGASIVTANSTNLVQFQNNNNDWHMADNNASEQNSAESLLRSALQGKGYPKGLHLQNGIAIIPPSNSVKDEELRRALFSPDQDSLHFADSTLSAQIFDDTPCIVSSPSSVHQQPPTPQTPNTPTSNNCSTNSNTSTSHSTTAGIVVDDMFLSLETAFNDDFEKIKRIANEVQQFCSSSDYPEVIMEITTAAALPSSTQPALQVLQQASSSQQQSHHQHHQSPHQLQQQQQQPPQPPPPPQPLQPEVTTSTSSATLTKSNAKKYKRSSATNSNNNNNNSSLPNNNSSSSGGGGGGSSSSNHNSPTQCNGQRKERSLHYCSICSKGFKDKYSVNVHIRTHTGEKPFACSLCGKSFRQKAHLAKHYQTHLAQKSNGNVVKGKQSQSSSGNRQNSAVTVVGTTAPSIQRSISASSNSSGSLPPANGLLANR